MTDAVPVGHCILRVLQVFQYHLELQLEKRQFRLYHIPYDVIINPKLIVNYNVTHSKNLRPWDFHLTVS
jgi:hypothetical protein